MDIIKGQTPLRFQRVAGINCPVVEVPVQGEEAQSFLKALRGYQRVHSYLPDLDVRETLLISVLPGAFVPLLRSNTLRDCAAHAVCHEVVPRSCAAQAVCPGSANQQEVPTDRETTKRGFTPGKCQGALPKDTTKRLEFLYLGIERYLTVQAGIQKLRKMVNTDDAEVSSLLRYSVPSGQKRSISYVPTTTRPCSKVRGAPPISVPAHVLVQFLEGNGWCLKSVRTSPGEFLAMCMEVSSLDELEEELFSLSDCFE